MRGFLIFFLALLIHSVFLLLFEHMEISYNSYFNVPLISNYIFDILIISNVTILGQFRFNDFSTYYDLCFPVSLHAWQFIIGDRSL